MIQLGGEAAERIPIPSNISCENEAHLIEHPRVYGYWLGMGGLGGLAVSVPLHHGSFVFS